MSQKTSYSSMMHLNNNLLCAIDTETTGLIAGHHDVIQVCFLPLDAQLMPHHEIIPFCLTLQPKRPENVDPKAMQVNKMNLADCILNGVDPWKAADLFEEWFTKLNLGGGKMIAPLSKNWPFDRGFINDWLGEEMVRQRIHYEYRDPGPVAKFFNDVADFRSENYPYPKSSLKYLASTLGIEEIQKHDAMSDCVMLAQVYRLMILRA